MAGLYIHIPFCEQRCAYCDFYKSTDTTRTTLFVEAVKREMTFRRTFVPDGRLDTIYIGGGTPSLLQPGQLQGLLEHAAGLWDCSALAEVTLEANPEDLADDYLARLSRTGFDRLSIGIQSFDDGLLRLMNRRHDSTRARQAVRAAQRAGFDNISIDLIFGIPGMTPQQWERSLDEAVALGVQHISAYHLTIEPGTVFGEMARRHERDGSPSALYRSQDASAACGDGWRPVDEIFRPVPEAESERQYETLRRKLGEAGFEHYEISNFALPGRRAVHNSAYWSGRPYLGVGPSAHSFDGGRRREWVVADLEEYMAGVGTKAIYGGENLSDRELFNERVMTGLRTSDGLDLNEIGRRFGAQRVAGLIGRAERFIAEGLLSGGTHPVEALRIPAGKFLLSDYIIGELFEG